MWLSPIKEDAPFDAGRSWLFGGQRSLATTLAVLAAALLVVGGVGLWMSGSWWRLFAVAGQATSFLLMVLYFHPWFIPIQVVNAALVIAHLWRNWPTEAVGV